VKDDHCWACEKTWVLLGCTNFNDRCIHAYRCTQEAVKNA